MVLMSMTNTIGSVAVSASIGCTLSGMPFPRHLFLAGRVPGTSDRLVSDIVRGGFVTVDPSVRRLRRPVARRPDSGVRVLLRSG